MTVIAVGSSLQIVIALLIVLIYLLLVLKLAPFQDETDDWLSFLTSFQMLITLLGGLIMTMDASEAQSQTYDPENMGTLLVFVNTIGFFAFAISLLLLHPTVRGRVDAIFEPKEETLTANLTKVKPDPGKGKKNDHTKFDEQETSGNNLTNAKSDEQKLKALREWN